MSMEVAGSIEVVSCVPSLTFDWMINDFEEWSGGDDDSYRTKKSPEMIVQGCRFQLLICEICGSILRPRISIKLCSLDQEIIELGLFSVHLVDTEGRQHQLCLKKELFNSKAVTSFLKTELEQKYLHNGQFRIRCKVEIKSFKKASPEEEEVPLLRASSSLVEDLCKENENLRFCDFTLVIT